MNSLYIGLHNEIVRYLETQEFMLYIRVSAEIYSKCRNLIKWRKPYIRVDCCPFRTPECLALIYELEKNNPLSKEYNHYDGPIVHAILILGVEKVSTAKYFRPRLIAVPWVFRKVLEYEVHDGYKLDVVQYDKFLRLKFIKYRDKIDNIPNPDLKAKQKIHYFDKLSNWERKLTAYQKTDDVYINAYNDRLEKLINK